jgi:hypothetical protein
MKAKRMTVRPLARVSDYDGLLAALRARADQINISGQQIDEIGGLPERYAQKVLSSISRKRGKQVRRIGMLSLGPILGALGIVLVVVEDPEAMRRIKSRLVPRKEYCVRGERADGAPQPAQPEQIAAQKTKIPERLRDGRRKTRSNARTRWRTSGALRSRAHRATLPEISL